MYLFVYKYLCVSQKKNIYTNLCILRKRLFSSVDLHIYILSFGRSLDTDHLVLVSEIQNDVEKKKKKHLLKKDNKKKNKIANLYR